jgi:hypothetical protein
MLDPKGVCTPPTALTSLAPFILPVLGLEVGHIHPPDNDRFPWLNDPCDIDEVPPDDISACMIVM